MNFVERWPHTYKNDKYAWSGMGMSTVYYSFVFPGFFWNVFHHKCKYFDFHNANFGLFWFPNTWDHIPQNYKHFLRLSLKQNKSYIQSHSWLRIVNLFLFTTYDDTCNDVHVNTLLECWGKLAVGNRCQINLRANTNYKQLH